MRLLLAGDWEPDEPGGPGAVALALVRELVALGHEVVVAAPAPGDRVRHEGAFAAGVEVVRVPVTGGPWLHRQTRRWASDLDVDAAVLLSVFTPHHVRIASRLGVPYVVMPLGGYAAASVRARRRTLKALWLRLAERAFLERAAAVDVWSRNEQADVLRLAPRLRNLVITPPGLPDGVVVRRSSRPLRTPRRVLYLGRFAVPQKGLDDLVLAFARAAVPGSRLTLAGVDHRGGLARLEDLVRRHGLEQLVEIRGPAYGEVKDRLFEEHDLFVHLSRWEGLPLAVVEALAAGLPVVVTPQTNVADLVERYGAGWVADDDAATVLRHALGATPDECSRRGSAAVRLVESEMSWSRVASTVVTALDGAAD